MAKYACHMPVANVCVWLELVSEGEVVCTRHRANENNILLNLFGGRPHDDVDDTKPKCVCVWFGVLLLMHYTTHYTVHIAH